MRLFTLLLVTGIALGTAPARADLSTGLLAHYPFGGNAADASGNANHGVLIGGMALTTDRFSVPDAAYEFNGMNSSIEAPYSTSLSSPTTAITQAAWILMYGMSQVGSAFAPITMKSATTENAMMYRLYATEAGLGVSYGNWSNGLFSTAPLPLQQWHHVASTYDGVKIRQYVNGVIVDSLVFSHTMVADSRPLRIGADTPGIFEVFYGKIDDLRIYDRALSDDEIAQLAGVTVGIERRLPAAGLSLAPPRPNPTRSGCTIDLSLPRAGDVHVAIYDVSGRLVRILAGEHHEAGRHSIAWDGRNALGQSTPAGLYLAGAKSGGEHRWVRVVRVP